MPILKISSAVEHYRYFSRPEFTIHSRAGHSENGLPNIKFVSARIVAALEPGKKDIRVDVGCGDGYLLARGAERGATCIGIVPTEEEREKLQNALPGIDFRLGLAQELPLESRCASKVVCNSVLVLLGGRRQRCTRTTGNFTHLPARCAHLVGRSPSRRRIVCPPHLPWGTLSLGCWCTNGDGRGRDRA